RFPLDAVRHADGHNRPRRQRAQRRPRPRRVDPGPAAGRCDPPGTRAAGDGRGRGGTGGAAGAGTARRRATAGPPAWRAPTTWRAPSVSEGSRREAAMTRWLVPEVVQTSAMDCGPAVLKAALQGFGIPVSYGRLREACQTDVDGTSIDTLEEVARQLGLDAEQVMLPMDHLLLPQTAALPAFLVTPQPNGFRHFVLVWRRHGPLVQVMDPGVGRRWVSCRRLLDEVYVHGHRVPAAAWRDWASSEAFRLPLARRLRDLGLGRDA